MLALHEHGLPVDVVLERFFPETPIATGRHRLRQVLLRLRAVAADLVTREEDQLRLADAWVDLREFLATAGRVHAAPGARKIQLAYAALAVHSGPLLPFDEYADWAHETREHVEHRYVSLLDLIATDAAQRGSHQEALTALDTIRRTGHSETKHATSLREHLLALGRHGTAGFLDQSAPG
jgi:DNA-binding SARP family transcriptional activator